MGTIAPPNLITLLILAHVISKFKYPFAPDPILAIFNVAGPIVTLVVVLYVVEVPLYSTLMLSIILAVVFCHGLLV